MSLAVIRLPPAGRPRLALKVQGKGSMVTAAISSLRAVSRSLAVKVSLGTELHSDTHTHTDGDE